jgi:primosomal protein N''
MESEEMIQKFNKILAQLEKMDESKVAELIFLAEQLLNQREQTNSHN